ncbi:uncharacterized protein ACO6RY_10067 [Pungitius sinensis]
MAGWAVRGCQSPDCPPPPPGRPIGSETKTPRLSQRSSHGARRHASERTPAWGPPPFPGVWLARVRTTQVLKPPVCASVKRQRCSASSAWEGAPRNKDPRLRAGGRASPSPLGAVARATWLILPVAYACLKD